MSNLYIVYLIFQRVENLSLTYYSYPYTGIFPGVYIIHDLLKYVLFREIQTDEGNLWNYIAS